MAATEADDRSVAAADAQLARTSGHDHKRLRGGSTADPLMPRHLPERHAHVDEAVDLETPATPIPDRFHGDHHLSGIRHRREPPEFPRGKRDRLAEHVSRDRLKRNRFFPRRVDGCGTSDERNPKVDRTAFLCHQARVIADVEKFIQDRRLWKVHTRPAIA